MNYSIPSPLPEEFSLSILRRFTRLNAMPSIAAAKRTLVASSDERRSTPLIWLLADMCHIDRIDFSNRHSLIPALFPVSKYADTPPDSQIRRGVAISYGFKTSSENLQWCPDCAKTDTEKYGLSYWHRTHQLMGHDWCLIHKTPLIASSKLNSTDLPGYPATWGSSQITNELIQQESDNPTLMRFQTIISEWLHLSSNISLRAWSNIIRLKCQELNLRQGESGKRRTVSDLVKEQFPLSWLYRHMPSVADKTQAAYVRKVDGATIDKHVAYPALSCAAILSVLFDSADAALKALDDAHKKSLVDEHRTHNTDLAVAAFKSGAAIQDVCKEFNIPPSDFEAALRERIFKQRHRG